MQSEYIKLRGHHLICLHFYNGSGFDDFYISQIQNLVSQASTNNVCIVGSADDLCLCCPYLKDYVCHFSNNSEQELIAMDSFALKLLESSVGNIVRWNDLFEKIERIFPIWWQKCCQCCIYKSDCMKNKDFSNLIKRHQFI